MLSSHFRSSWLSCCAFMCSPTLVKLLLAVGSTTVRCRCAPRGMCYADRWLSYVAADLNWKGLPLAGEPVLLARVFLPFHAPAGTGNVALRSTLLGLFP